MPFSKDRLLIEKQVLLFLRQGIPYKAETKSGALLVCSSEVILYRDSSTWASSQEVYT